jgi:hypothetical protein
VLSVKPVLAGRNLGCGGLDPGWCSGCEIETTPLFDQLDPRGLGEADNNICVASNSGVGSENNRFGELLLCCDRTGCLNDALDSGKLLDFR